MTDPLAMNLESPAPADYTLEDLERESGVTARTIRFYRQAGLIAPPRRVGRFAFYGPEQLSRLRLIAALRARGLGLDAVAKVLADPAGESRSFSSLLEIRDQLLEPWIDDREMLMDREQVLAVIGGRDARVVDDLVAFGLVRPAGEQFRVPSVATLHLAAQLMAAGVEPEVAATAWTLMQEYTGALSTALVKLFVERSTYGFAGEPTAVAVAAAFRELRSVALRAVQLAFAHEIERALEDYVTAEAGPGDQPVPSVPAGSPGVEPPAPLGTDGR